MAETSKESAAVLGEAAKRELKGLAGKRFVDKNRTVRVRAMAKYIFLFMVHLRCKEFVPCIWQ